MSPSTGTREVASSTVGNETVLRLGWAYLTADFQKNYRARNLAELIKERSNGKIILADFPTAHLGNEINLYEKVNKARWMLHLPCLLSTIKILQDGGKQCHGGDLILSMADSQSMSLLLVSVLLLGAVKEKRRCYRLWFYLWTCCKLLCYFSDIRKSKSDPARAARGKKAAKRIPWQPFLRF